MEEVGIVRGYTIEMDREALGPPEVYGSDRVFVHLRLADEPDTTQKQKLDSLRSAGHPVVKIELADIYDLGQEFFRWEIATAVAGSILKINPFNQPDVEASKIVTRQLTEAYEKTGKLPEEAPILDEGGIKLASHQGLGQHRRVIARQADFDAGKLVAKDALHLGQQTNFGPRHEAKGECRSRRLSCAQRCLLGGFRLNQRHSCMVEKGFPCRRQLDTVSAAVQQLNPDFLFEIPDLPAERWLRSVQLLLGGNGQTAGVGHGDEVAQMPELHLNVPYLASMGPFTDPGRRH